MRFLLFLCFLIFFSFLGNAQLDLVKEAELENIQERLSDGLAQLESAKVAPLSEGMFEALLNLGDLYRSKRNYNKAIEYYRQAMGHSHPIDNADRHYLIQNRLARVLFANAQYEEAIYWRVGSRCRR